MEKGTQLNYTVMAQTVATFRRAGTVDEACFEEIRPAYQFNESCQDTVPQAIIAFLESTDFEDAIRNAISIGGDSDTLAAITGSIAEAAYGIPDWIKDKAWSYLDEPLKDVCRSWKTFIETHKRS